MRTFYNYLIDNEDYNLKNVWKKVKLKSEKPTDISISENDYQYSYLPIGKELLELLNGLNLDINKVDIPVILYHYNFWFYN